MTGREVSEVEVRAREREQATRTAAKSSRQLRAEARGWQVELDRTPVTPFLMKSRRNMRLRIAQLRREAALARVDEERSAA